MTDQERKELGKGKLFSASGKDLIVADLRKWAGDLLADAVTDAKLSTFSVFGFDFVKFEEDTVPMHCLAIGCFNLMQLEIIDVGMNRIGVCLDTLGFTFDWVSAGMCI